MLIYDTIYLKRGESYKRLRKSKNFTQEELADKIFISKLEGRVLMKKRIILLISVISFFCTACSPSGSSNDYSEEQVEIEKILIGNINPTENVEVTSSNNHFEFEVAKNYRIYFQVSDNDFKEDINVEIETKFNMDSSDIVYDYTNDYSNIVAYSLYPLKISENNKVELIYKEKSYCFTYDIVDFSFNKSKKISSLDDLSIYPEFVEMIQSIEYYNFFEPYVGLDSYGGSMYWGEYSWDYSFKDDLYDLGYLQYLTDSIYYPTKMNLVAENEIANRNAIMYFNDESSIIEGASRTIIERFIIDYSVIDPCCTNPTHPLQSISYVVIPKKTKSTSELTKSYYIKTYRSTYYLLSKIYPEEYYHLEYRDLDISIIKVEGDNILAFFEDDTYIYMVGYGYVF